MSHREDVMTEKNETRITDMTDLAQFNPSRSKSHDPDLLPVVEPVVSLPIPNLFEGTKKVLAFDQAIANTGWCLCLNQEGIVTEVLDAGTIKTVASEERTSWDDTLTRSVQVMSGVLELLWKHVPDLVLHEMPPVGTGPFMRGTYSSVCAAVAVRCAAMQAALPVDQVSAQTVKKILTGNANAKKSEVRKAINKLLENGQLLLNPEMKIRLNEHIVDAIGIFLSFGQSS
jgi:Holliday junction resolvasome RuvABC endonuclease subunit